MGKMIEHPRYNVLSVRVTDEELEYIRRAMAANRQKSIQQYLHSRIMIDVVGMMLTDMQPKISSPSMMSVSPSCASMAG